MTQQIDAQTIKQQVQKDWGRAAAGWRKHDARLRQLSAPVTQRLLELAGVAPGQRVLDIASGTGEPAIPAAAAAGPKGHVLATDLSEEMLEVAREKAEAAALTNIQFRRVDGEELDLEPNSFDAALCRWGIMFMPEPLRCLKQAHRALKAGGRMAVSVWGPLERNPFIVLPMVIIRKYVQGPLPDPTAPGSVFSFADRSRLDFVFTQAGFREIRIEDLELPMAVFDSGWEFWRYCQEVMGPVGALIAQMSPEVQETVGKEVASAAGGGDAGAKVSLNGYTLLASATK